MPTSSSPITVTTTPKPPTSGSSRSRWSVLRKVRYPLLVIWGIFVTVGASAGFAAIGGVNEVAAQTQKNPAQARYTINVNPLAPLGTLAKTVGEALWDILTSPFFWTPASVVAAVAITVYVMKRKTP